MFEAWDADGKRLGTFAAERDAADAISTSLLRPHIQIAGVACPSSICAFLT
jgi:hypothetical protein